MERILRVMSDNLSHDRQVRNEQLIRDRNTKLKDGILKYFRNNIKIKALPVKFVCECSAIDCKETVELSIAAYEKIHARQDQFAIAKGHGTPEVEKVVKKHPSFHIVEKQQLTP